jgi:hypothetical protein
VLYPDRVTPQRQVEMLELLLRSFRSPAQPAPEAGVAAATDAG